MMEFEFARLNMLKQQIMPFCLVSKPIAELIGVAKREQFVDAKFKQLAYADVEIPLPNNCKMFTPKMEAFILQHLQLNNKCKVLEIGSGSGYLTYLLACLAKFVYSFEIDENNNKLAVNNVVNQGANNISIVNKDGFENATNYAPFERIVVGGAVHSDLAFTVLRQQLSINGILIGFVGCELQQLVKIIRIDENNFKTEHLLETQVEFLYCEDSKPDFIF